jgi:hypothetical protein
MDNKIAALKSYFPIYPLFRHRIKGEKARCDFQGSLSQKRAFPGRRRNTFPDELTGIGAARCQPLS